MNEPVEQGAVPLAEMWRGPFAESVHLGHAVIADQHGVVQAWGHAETLILPRSSVKMIQALPLVESGAELTSEQLALACASHEGGQEHTDRVARWLSELGLTEADLRCGVQPARDRSERVRLRESGQGACQLHNNCSGKHAGFLTLNQHLGGDADYVDPDHPVQRAVRTAFEEVTGRDSPGFGIDGCSAPNFACRLDDLARAMAWFARPTGGGARAAAAVRLQEAMRAHPGLVGGQGRACTELMQAMGGQVAIKVGAEAIYVAILPELGLGIALKVVDGGVRAAECAMAALLVRLGVLASDHPASLRRMNTVERNFRGIETGSLRPAPALLA